MSEIDIRMTRVRAQLIQEHPFFGALAMRLVLREWTENDTMATDGSFLFYAKKFLDKMSETIVLFAVAHEVLHCALGHHTRRGNRNHQLWNIACDYVVNLMLKHAGFTVPSWCYCDEQFAGLNAEEVYRVLEQQQKQQPQQGANQCGSPQNDGTSPTSPNADAKEKEQDGGSTPDQSGDDTPSASAGGTSTPDFPPSHGDPGGCGEILDAAPPHDQAGLAEAAEEWQVYTRQAASIAKKAGDLPSFVEEVMEELNDPQVDWRDVLRRFVDPSSTKDYSWTQPNRRLLGLGYLVPGMISDGVNHVALCVDSSGSMDQDKLRQIGGETQAALDDGAIDKVTVLFADTQVHRAVEYNKGDLIDFTVAGRGGTKFSPTFDWLNENAPDISAAIYFTDLECLDYGPEPSYPVLWAVYGNDPRTVKEYVKDIPWGEIVEVK